MTELKTLKDILKPDDYHGDMAASESDLRDEAIRWVKSLEGKGPVPAKENLVKALTSAGKIMWIKEFFNLTKEDLQ